MNAATYPVGTVAVATVRGVEDVRVVRVAGGSTGHWCSADLIDTWHFHSDPVCTDVRPLVVLDLSDPAFVVAALKSAADGGEVAAHGYQPWPGRGALRDLAYRIEEQTRPPKPAEPTGLGAVVERKGVRFVRNPDGVWVSEDDRLFWHELSAVTILSQGVPS